MPRREGESESHSSDSEPETAEEEGKRKKEKDSPKHDAKLLELERAELALERQQLALEREKLTLQKKKSSSQRSQPRSQPSSQRKLEPMEVEHREGDRDHMQGQKPLISTCMWVMIASVLTLLAALLFLLWKTDGGTPSNGDGGAAAESTVVAGPSGMSRAEESGLLLTLNATVALLAAQLRQLATVQVRQSGQLDELLERVQSLEASNKTAMDQLQGVNMGLEQAIAVGAGPRLLALEAVRVPTALSNLTDDLGILTTSDGYALQSSVPTSISELNNDVGFITAADVPTKTGQLVNDANFTTAADFPSSLSPFVNDVGFVTAADLPVVPMNLSAFQDDVGYATEAELLSGAGEPGELKLFETDGCPQGWSLVTEADGKFLVGGTSFNASTAASLATTVVGDHTHGYTGHSCTGCPRGATSGAGGGHSHSLAVEGLLVVLCRRD